MDPTNLPLNWARLVRRPLSQRESESTWKQMDDALARVRAWLLASGGASTDGQQTVRQQLRQDWPQLVLPCVRVP